MVMFFWFNSFNTNFKADSLSKIMRKGWQDASQIYQGFKIQTSPVGRFINSSAANESTTDQTLTPINQSIETNQTNDTQEKTNN